MCYLIYTFNIYIRTNVDIPRYDNIIMIYMTTFYIRNLHYQVQAFNS